LCCGYVVNIHGRKNAQCHQDDRPIGRSKWGLVRSQRELQAIVQPREFPKHRYRQMQRIVTCCKSSCSEPVVKTDMDAHRILEMQRCGMTSIGKPKLTLPSHGPNSPTPMPRSPGSTPN